MIDSIAAIKNDNWMLFGYVEMQGTRELATIASLEKSVIWSQGTEGQAG